MFVAGRLDESELSSMSATRDHICSSPRVFLSQVARLLPRVLYATLTPDALQLVLVAVDPEPLREHAIWPLVPSRGTGTFEGVFPLGTRAGRRSRRRRRRRRRKNEAFFFFSAAAARRCRGRVVFECRSLSLSLSLRPEVLPARSAMMSDVVAGLEPTELTAATAPRPGTRVSTDDRAQSLFAEMKIHHTSQIGSD